MNDSANFKRTQRENQSTFSPPSSPQSDQTHQSPSNQTSSDSWCLIEAPGLLLSSPEAKTEKDFLDICGNGAYHGDRYDGFLELERVLSIYGVTFSQNCYVQGFNVAASVDEIRICKHIFEKRNVFNGSLRTKFDILWRNSFQAKERECIDSKLFITCCEKNSVNVIKWMMIVNLFNYNVLKIAFETACISQNTKIMSLIHHELYTRNICDLTNMANILICCASDGRTRSLEWFYQINPHMFMSVLQLMLTQICKNGRSETLKFVIGVTTRKIAVDLLHQCFISACVGGHKETAMILRGYDMPGHMNKYIDNLEDRIFTDPDKQIFFVAMTNKRHNILEWLNDFKHHHLTINLIDVDDDSGTQCIPPLVSMIIPECEIDKCTKYIASPGCKLSEFVIVTSDSTSSDRLLNKTNSYGMKVPVTDGKFNEHMLHRLFVESHESTKFSDGCYERMFQCKKITGERSDINYVINVLIRTERYIGINSLFQILSRCETVAEKNVIAGLLGHHINPRVKLTYKDMMLDKLGLNITDKNSDVVSKIMFETDECPLCMCEYDMMLACGHVMCMSCAVGWYITKGKPMICYICQKPFLMKDGYCLC